jgi:acyl-CoA oxidase
MHTVGFLFQKFYDSVKKAPKELQDIMGKLCHLYGLLKIQEQSGKFLQHGYLQPLHLEQVETKILEYYHDLRDQIIPLSDSFNYSDFIINSPLGCYDGDVYRRYFEQVLANNPPKKPVYFESLLKPLFEQKEMQIDRLELEDEDDTRSNL